MLDVLSTSPFPLRPGLRWPFGLFATAAMLCCVLVPLPPAQRHLEQNEPLFAQHRQCTGRENLLEVVPIAQLSSPKLPATSQAAIMHLSNVLPQSRSYSACMGSHKVQKSSFTHPPHEHMTQRMVPARLLVGGMDAGVIWWKTRCSLRSGIMARATVRERHSTLNSRKHAASRARNVRPAPEKPLTCNTCSVESPLLHSHRCPNGEHNLQ